MTTALTLSGSPQTLDRYIEEVEKYPLLSREEELDLAHRYQDHNDVAAAHQLVVSNLRFVVKVAHEYRGYGLALLDLIQEGNIGLMHAVKKFNPSRGYRLITYAVWWIRAQIQDYILKTWSLVKIGGGRVARRLFFKLRSTLSKAEQETEGAGRERVSTVVSRRLGASEEAVTEMEARLAARDFQLDAKISEDSDASRLDQLPDERPSPEDLATEREEREIVERALSEVESTLDEKERFILERRLTCEDPQTFSEVGDHFGISRQRVQQIESRLVGKIRDRVLMAKPDPKLLVA